MEWSKIKNIAILILLVTNAVLLAIVGTQLSSSARYREDTRRQALTVLEQSGIQFTPAMLPDDLSLPVLTVTRDRAAEREMAHALLGADIRASEQSGGIRITYSAAVGSADFYSSGRFSFHFTGDLWTLGNLTPAAHAQQCMERLGLSGTLLPGGDADEATVTLCQMWEEIPLFDCTVSFTYEGEALRSIAGQYLSGSVAAAGDTVSMTTATALLRFLSGSNESGYICSQITGMRCGYQTDTARPVSLHPVWYFTTDTQSTYLLDAATGELTRLSAAGEGTLPRSS